MRERRDTPIIPYRPLLLVRVCSAFTRIFSQRTNRMQEEWVYSHNGPIGHDRRDLARRLRAPQVLQRAAVRVHPPD